MIPDLYKYSAIAVAIALLLVLSYSKGRESGLEKYHEFKAKVEEQQNALEKENRELRQLSESITRDVSVAWDRALRADRRVRVRVLQPVRTACDPAGLRSIPSTPGISPKLPVEEPRFGPGGDVTVAVEECQQRIETAITDAAWIEHVKVWVDKQSKVRK